MKYGVIFKTKKYKGMKLRKSPRKAALSSELSGKIFFTPSLKTAPDMSFI